MTQDYLTGVNNCVSRQLPNVCCTMCGLRLHYICTTYVLRMHYICTTYALHMHYVCTTYALRMHYVCTTHALRMQNLTTNIFVLPLIKRDVLGYKLLFDLCSVSRQSTPSKAPISCQDSSHAYSVGQAARGGSRRSGVRLIQSRCVMLRRHTRRLN